MKLSSKVMFCMPLVAFLAIGCVESNAPEATDTSGGTDAPEATDPSSEAGIIVEPEDEPDIRIVCMSSEVENEDEPSTLALWEITDGVKGGIVKVDEAEVTLKTGDRVEVVEPLQEAKVSVENGSSRKFIKVTTTLEEGSSSTVVEGWAQDNYLFSSDSCPEHSDSSK